MRIGFGDAMRIAGEKKHDRDFSNEDSKVTKHLSKFHIYALVYCIVVFLSGLLHSV